MKVNWGYRITLLYLGFVGLIAYLMYRSVNEKIDLVTPDYYAAELTYEHRIESIRRNNALPEAIGISMHDDAIRIDFPESFRQASLAGTIHLFRPSDDHLDRSYPIAPGAALSQVIDAGELHAGLYHIQIDYTLNGVAYYTEKKLVVRVENTTPIDHPATAPKAVSTQ